MCVYNITWHDVTWWFITMTSCDVTDSLSDLKAADWILTTGGRKCLEHDTKYKIKALIAIRVRWVQDFLKVFLPLSDNILSPVQQFSSLLKTAWTNPLVRTSLTPTESPSSLSPRIPPTLEFLLLLRQKLLSSDFLIPAASGVSWAKMGWKDSFSLMTSFAASLHQQVVWLSPQLFLDTLETFTMAHSDSMSSGSPGCRNSSSGGRCWRCSQFTLDYVNQFGFTRSVQQPPPSPVSKTYGRSDEKTTNNRWSLVSGEPELRWVDLYVVDATQPPAPTLPPSFQRGDFPRT